MMLRHRTGSGVADKVQHHSEGHHTDRNSWNGQKCLGDGVRITDRGQSRSQSLGWSNFTVTCLPGTPGIRASLVELGFSLAVNKPSLQVLGRECHISNATSSTIKLALVLP